MIKRAFNQKVKLRLPKSHSPIILPRLATGGTETVAEGTDLHLCLDLNALDVAMFVVNVEEGEHFRIFGINAAAEREAGYPSSQVEGLTFIEWLGPELGGAITERYATCLRTRVALQFEAHGALTYGGQWYRTTLSPYVDPLTGVVTRIVAVSQNITAVKRLQLEMKAAAFTDPLTGLANRRAFDQAVADATDEAVYSSGCFALAVVDLDGLKRINDTLGHRFGDNVICCVGTLLQNALQPSEMVARIGGDEFYLLLREATRVGLDARLHRLRAAIEDCAPIEGYGRPIRLSLGGAVWHPGDDAYEILAAADAAMYLEKGVRALAQSDGVDKATTRTFRKTVGTSRVGTV